MKKILYISYDGIFDPVGQSQILPYLLGLEKKGINIFLISFEKIIRFNTEPHSPISENIEGIHWSPLIYHKKPAIPATLFDIFCGFLKGLILIRKNKIRIIQARGYIAGIIAWLIKIFNKINFIFDMRGFWPEEKIDAGVWKKRSALYRLIKYIERLLIQGADEIIVLTESASKIIMQKYGLANITVIPCCVDLGLFSRNTNIASDSSFLNSCTVTYLGSVGTFYDFEEAVRFFSVFKKRFPKAFFLILSGSEKKYILGILDKHGIPQLNYKIASVSHEEVPSFLQQSSLSLIFYRRFLSAAGCCPIKFAESLACGVPVIINTGIGDCDRIVNQERIGIILKGQSPEFYEQATYEAEHILGNKNEIRERCRNAARKYFSLQDGINKYFNIYSRLNND